jgi:hypothetical protein
MADDNAPLSKAYMQPLRMAAKDVDGHESTLLMEVNKLVSLLGGVAAKWDNADMVTPHEPGRLLAAHKLNAEGIEEVKEAHRIIKTAVNIGMGFVREDSTTLTTQDIRNALNGADGLLADDAHNIKAAHFKRVIADALEVLSRPNKEQLLEQVHQR